MIIVLIVAAGVFYFSLAFNSVFYPPDEGATVYHFEKSREGAVQHRDFFSVYGAGYYVFGTALFKLFGSSLIVTRVFVFALKLVMAVLIYLIALRLMRSSFAFLSSLVFIIWWGDPSVPTPSFLYPSHISHFLGLLSILFLLVYDGTNRRFWVGCAGLSAGLGCLFKPTTGILSLLAFFLFLFVRGQSEIF
jgi:4-amino-4-deoxy-L-arabinose transferase-like glycosyltransferase